MRHTWVAYLLWLLPPLMGGHRLYCNRIGTGVLWHFTAGGLVIGWLIDLFLIPRMVREANLEATVARHDAALGQQPTIGDQAAKGNRVIYCTSCGSPMQVPVSQSGSFYKCPTCGHPLTVPS